MSFRRTRAVNSTSALMDKSTSNTSALPEGKPFLEPLEENLRLDQTHFRSWPARSQRSSSLFTNISSFLVPWRPNDNGATKSRNGKSLIRRYSSPVLSKCGGSHRNEEQFESNSKGHHCDGPAAFLTDRQLPEERELVSRSVSMSLDDDSELYESFCPSDLEVKELLGKGFYGEVFKVIHRKTGSAMVMKRLYRLDAKCENDFLKEVAVMRQLHHPNVLRFLGVLYNDKKIHLITEYVSGGTLRNLLESTEPLTWYRRLAIAHDIACGMAYLHSRNIIHRDLNSENILIREEDCSAVVADFGLSRILGRRRAGRRRRLTVVGDPYFMAPEMAKEKCYNENVDVFSYGVTLCEIIGRCSSDPDVMTRRQDFGIDEQCFTSRFVDASCPKSFLELAFKCAAVNADERPPFSVIERWLVEMLANYHVDTDFNYETMSSDIRKFRVDHDSSEDDGKTSLA